MAPKVESSSLFFYPSMVCSCRLVIRTLGFQPEGGSLILLRSKVEGLFYLFALGVIISGIMVISAYTPVYAVL